MISASTKLFAVIGDPIGHSLSPVMQNCFINQFGLDAVYMAFHVKNSNLQTCVEGMKSVGIGGLNVTVPHKEAILPFIDAKSEEVLKLGAANTLKNVDGHIEGYVTDPYGFTESIFQNRGRFKDAKVMLFGAGGAAKSVAFALSMLGVQRLIVSDLVAEKTRELVSLCRDSFGLAQTSSLSDSDASLSDILADSNIIINATAVGMHPLQEKSVVEEFSAISNNHFCYDLVYNPGKTKFLRHAEKAGAAIQNGLDMLIFQGLQSMRIWTGKELKLDEKQLQFVRKIMNEQLGIHE